MLFILNKNGNIKKERDFLCPERKLEKVSLMRLSNTNDYRRRPKALIIAR